MAFFDWEERYSVGIFAIDEQHKRLVALLNELYEAMGAGEGRDALGHILARLIQYTRTHFAAEEQMFERHHYPHAQEHIDEHNKLTQSVLDLEKRFREGDITVTIEASTFLKEWLAHHILETDMRYRSYLSH
jgi:hemerythrin